MNELDHSTIPLYLTAYFSIKEGTKLKIAEILYDIVVEEMLHFTIACNVLNAIGGNPRIYDPTFCIK